MVLKIQKGEIHLTTTMDPKVLRDYSHMVMEVARLSKKPPTMDYPSDRVSE